MITLAQCCRCEVTRRIKARKLCFACYNFYYRKGLIRNRGVQTRPYRTWTPAERQVVLQSIGQGQVYNDVKGLLPGRTRKQYNSVRWNIIHQVTTWITRQKKQGPTPCKEPTPEPTMEDIERTIREQQKFLPEWWEQDEARCDRSSLERPGERVAPRAARPLRVRVR